MNRLTKSGGTRPRESEDSGLRGLALTQLAGQGEYGRGSGPRQSWAKGAWDGRAACSGDGVFLVCRGTADCECRQAPSLEVEAEVGLQLTPLAS